MLNRILETSEYVAIDTETNGKDVRDGRGVCYGISFATDRVAFYLPFRHTADPENNLSIHEFHDVIQKILDTKKLIYFNAKFDIVSLGTLGLNAKRTPVFYCTQVLSHLIDENRPFAGKSLDAVSKLYLGEEGGKEKDEDYLACLAMFGYEGMPGEATASYASRDAEVTWDLYWKLRPVLIEMGLGEVWRHKQKMILRLIEMESKGIGIDTNLCDEMSVKGRKEMEVLRSKLGGYNPSSPRDLEALLVDMMGLPIVKLTPKGKPCFDKFAMEIYETEYLAPSDKPEAKYIMAYRGWSKSCSSNYEPYMSLLSPDNLLRPDYLLFGTVTGRLSCRNPNLQQIPRAGVKPWNGRMKKCFVPRREGFTLVEFDYSQLEFRLSTHFSGQAELVEIFNDPERDVFQEIANEMGLERHQAKTLVYSILYGAGPRRIANVFSVSYAEGKRIRDNFFSIYRNLLRASNFASSRAQTDRHIRLWSGRYRHFLNPKEEAHKAYNSFIQGTAADLVERAMVSSSIYEDPETAMMLLQVHDSVIWEIREDRLVEKVTQIRQSMEGLGQEWTVPFKVDAHYWGGDKIAA